MIKATNLTKKFGDFTAVDDISFEVKKGEVVGFLGPNGAGKTTTMRMLTGFMMPDEGEITIDGMRLDEKEMEIKSLIGYMPENNPIYKDMLVNELLELTLELNNINKSEWSERVDYVLNAVDIKDKYYRPINELSKGYKQRVGIAQALINRPKFLILDEPTEGLDPNQRTEIRKLIKTAGEEMTVLVSTHVMQEVEAMCSRIIIIDKGKIIADGSKEELAKGKSGVAKVNIIMKGKNIVKEISRINNVKVSDESLKDGRTSFEIEIVSNDLNKISEEISGLIAKNRWTIYKYEPKQNTLEDLFHELTLSENQS